MGLSSLLVLSLALAFVLVSSAPIEKSPEVVEVAKRDQEMILFGNQQNDPRLKKKKSDPSMPVVADDNTVDKQGFIEAEPQAPAQPVEPLQEVVNTEVSQEQSEPAVEVPADDSQEQEPKSEEQTSESGEQSGESVEAELPPIKQQMPEESVADDTPVADNVEEELKDMMADSKEAASEETQEPEEDNELPEEDGEEEATEAGEPAGEQEISEATEMVPAEPEEDNTLKDLYYYIMENEKEEPQNSDYYYDLGYYPYRKRRSSRRARAVTEGGMVRNELQRSKRIKRDLFDDDEEEYYIPYIEEEYEPELSEADLYGLYNVQQPKPKYEDEVETLLNMYQEAPSSLTYNPYEAYQVEDVYPEVYQEEEPEQEPQYVPSKRQMMSSLPGIKKRYFYPFSREPETHWGAFIPQQKRDYDDAYNRLLSLASALSEESPYYQVYKKK